MRHFHWLLVLLLLCSFAHAEEPLVTADFVNADIVYVVKVLAYAWKRHSYVDHSVDGQVTMSFRAVPVSEALTRVLGERYSYRVLDDGTILVAEPDRIDNVEYGVIKCPVRKLPPNGIRVEFVLQSAPSGQVVEKLMARYPDVVFVPHPSKNGFYAVGFKQDLDSIAREIPSLDRPVR